MFRAVSDGWKRYWWGTGILPDRCNRTEDIYLRFYNGSIHAANLLQKNLPDLSAIVPTVLRLARETDVKENDEQCVSPSPLNFRRTIEEYIDIPLCQASSLLEMKGFQKDNPTILYVHGFIEVAQQESVQVIVSAYLEARPDTNVVLLDWSNMSHGSYLVNAARNTKKVGECAADELNRLIETGLPLDKLHIIGHSLGSHVAGYTARELKNKCNKTVKRLTALDPAFPAFYPDGVMMDHVSAKDAEFVDVIHTDAGGYGAPVKTGTADFWPNGGKSIQPGCPRFAPIPLSDDNVNAKQPCCASFIESLRNRINCLRPRIVNPDLCSHWRSWRFYAESVRNPEAFPASPADSYVKFKENPKPEENMVYMGHNCDNSAKGSYYLITNAQEPYGKGMEGLYHKSKKSSPKKEKS